LGTFKGENRLQIFNNLKVETRKKKQKNIPFHVPTNFSLFLILNEPFCARLFLGLKHILNVYFVQIRYEFEKNGEIAEKVAKKFTTKS
jgi:hypothetical protein